MRLLVDVGNTRAKWAVLRDGALSPAGAVVHRGLSAGDWVAALDAAGDRCERMLVSNVAGPVAAQALAEWALARFGLQPEFIRAGAAGGGIRNAYDEPQSLGSDRWLAMIGAWSRARAPLLCVTAGTAMTLDAVDAAGHHLGGLIVPGYDMMIDALLRRTSDISTAAALAPATATGMLGRNTAGAVELGAAQAMAALAARTADWVEREAGVRPRLFLGGGDAARIERLLGMPAELAPQLVLEGLAVIAEEA